MIFIKKIEIEINELQKEPCGISWIFRNRLL